VFLLDNSSDNGQLTSQLILLAICYSSETWKVGMASVSPSVWYKYGTQNWKFVANLFLKSLPFFLYTNWDSHSGESEEYGLLECDVAVIWQIAVSQKSTCCFCLQYIRKRRQHVTGTCLQNCVVLHYRKRLSEFDCCNLCQHRYEKLLSRLYICLDLHAVTLCECCYWVLIGNIVPPLLRYTERRCVCGCLYCRCENWNYRVLLLLICVQL
jgi:hypothetical protein